MRAVGLFDVPLTPYVFVSSESALTVCKLVCYVIAMACKADPEAKPLGWVQDNTEHMFNTVCYLLEKMFAPEILRGDVCIDRSAKSVAGFTLVLRFGVA